MAGFPDEVLTKDGRAKRKREHGGSYKHTTLATVGPSGTITRQGKAGADPFGLTANNVEYSLDKDRRWEMESVALNRLTIEERKSSKPASLTSVQLPVTCKAHPQNPQLVKHTQVAKGGDVKEFTPKSNRATTAALSEHDESSRGTEYTVAHVSRPTPKQHEATWRYHQRQGNVKTITRRGKQLHDELNDSYQEELEQELNEQQELLDADVAGTSQAFVKPKRIDAVIKHRQPIGRPNRRGIRQRHSDRLRVQNVELSVYAKEVKEYSKNIELLQPLSSIHLAEDMLAAHVEQPIQYLDVLPPTFILHKEETSRVLGYATASCILVKRQHNGEHIAYSAPSFCCKPKSISSGTDWIPLTHESIEVFKTTEAPPSMKMDAHSFPLTCNHFGLSCGHVFETQQYLEHVKKTMREAACPVRCMASDCAEEMDLTQASALLSPGAQWIYRNEIFNALVEQSRGLSCYSCGGLILVPKKTTGAREFIATCECGIRICTLCRRREHAPLSCEIYEEWREIVASTFVRNPALTNKPPAVVSEKDQDRFYKSMTVEYSFCMKCRKYLFSCMYHDVFCSKCAKDFKTGKRKLLPLPIQMVHTLYPLFELGRPHYSKGVRFGWSYYRNPATFRPVDQLLYDAARSIILILVAREAVEMNMMEAPEGKTAANMQRHECALEAALSAAAACENIVTAEAEDDVRRALNEWRAAHGRYERKDRREKEYKAVLDD